MSYPITKEIAGNLLREFAILQGKTQVQGLDDHADIKFQGFLVACRIALGYDRSNLPPVERNIFSELTSIAKGLTTT